MGLRPVPALDLLTLYVDEKAPANIMTVSTFNINTSHLVDKYFERLVTNHVKMRSVIVRVAGDYYYKEISIDDAKKATLIEIPDGSITNEEQVRQFVNK